MKNLAQTVLSIEEYQVIEDTIASLKIIKLIMDNHILLRSFRETLIFADAEITLEYQIPIRVIDKLLGVVVSDTFRVDEAIKIMRSHQLTLDIF